MSGSLRRRACVIVRRMARSKERDDASTVARAPLAPESAERLRRIVIVEGPDAGLEFMLEPSSPSRTLLGTSLAMRRLYHLCERLAKSRVPVIIEGETGTGKEVLAESLHEVGGGSGPFVVFDCTAVSTNLLEAALFGHERGAFTGAVAAR